MSNQSQIISSGPIGEPKAYALEVFMYKGDASQQEAIQKMKVHVAYIVHSWQSQADCKALIHGEFSFSRKDLHIECFRTLCDLQLEYRSTGDMAYAFAKLFVLW